MALQIFKNFSRGRYPGPRNWYSALRSSAYARSSEEFMLAPLTESMSRIASKSTIVTFALLLIFSHSFILLHVEIGV